MLSQHPIPALSDLFFPKRVKPTLELLAIPDLELTYNARGALLRACTEIAQNGKCDILIPGFHCPSGVTPAIEAGLRPVFYRIRRDLSIDYEDLLSRVGPNTGAVLVIHFFGIAADLRPLAQIRANGVALIEDWSHSFIQGEPPRLAGTDGDYRVYSFWKLVPSGVGGGLVRGQLTKNAVLPSRPAPAMQRLVNLKQLFEEALDHSGYPLARAAFSRIERVRLALRRSPPPPSQSKPQQPKGEDYYPFSRRLAESAMPALARGVIESTDLGHVARQRRTNFLLYAKLLKDLAFLRPLCTALPADACPWVFPVLLQDRDAIDHHWRDAGVALHTFGIHLHSALFETADDRTIEDAKFLADSVLCLAIHQDITEREIENVVRIIRSSGPIFP